jgi:hypothetical protein
VVRQGPRMTNRNRARKMGLAGRAAALERYSSTGVAVRTRGVYRAVLTSPGNG